MDLQWSDPASEARFSAYLQRLSGCLGHADRVGPFRGYCTGLLLAGERKSVEPMAARLCPERTSAEHQSLLHFVGQSPWEAEALLARVREAVLPALTARAPIEAWLVDDTGIPKKGAHSVGVAHQYCGQRGKQENCRVAVSLSVATGKASLPIAWRLYLPQAWAGDRKRRRQVGVPDEIRFETKPQIALSQIRQALADDIEPGVVLADAAYGNDSAFRGELAQRGLKYVVGIRSSTTVWRPGQGPPPAKSYSGRGRPPKRLRRGKQQPVTVKELAGELLATKAFRALSWREGTRQKLRSRFAAVRVRAAHRDDKQQEPHSEQWLLIEWPAKQVEPTHYWLANLGAQTTRQDLVTLAKHRWIIERDYQELKQELGLGHYEGRGWRCFHHHATLCIAAYGFLVAERSLFSPSTRIARLQLPLPKPPRDFRPRGAPDSTRAA